MLIFFTCASGAPEKVYGDDEAQIAEIEQRAILADLRMIPSRIRHLGSGRTPGDSPGDERIPGG